MPFVTVATTLAANQLPAQFMPNLCEAIAKAINRDPRLLSWSLDTGKLMSMGPNNERGTYMQIRIEGFEVFDTKEQTVELIPKVFKHLTENTCLMEDEIHIICYPLQLWRIGLHGQALLKVPDLD